MAMTAHQKQLVQRLAKDEERWKEKKLKFKSLDDVLEENKIKKESL